MSKENHTFSLGRLQSISHYMIFGRRAKSLVFCYANFLYSFLYILKPSDSDFNYIYKLNSKTVFAFPCQPHFNYNTEYFKMY